MSEVAELPKSKKIKGGTIVSKISINSKRLLNACNKAAKAIDAKSIVPAISNILIEVVGDSLRLTGTNLRQTVVTKAYYGEIGSQAYFMFPAGPGIKLLQNLPDASVEVSHITSIQKSGEVETVSHQVEITCNGNSYSFESDDPKDFVKVVNLSDQEPLLISGEQIDKGILFCAPFTSTDGLRPSMTGINFDIKANKLSMNATDGFAISMYETELSDPVEKDITFILPAKASVLLSELNKGNIELRIANNGVEFSDGATSIFSLIIDERFPDITNAIPNSHSTSITVDANDLKSALNRISILSSNAQTHMLLSEKVLSINTIGINENSDGNEDVLVSDFSGDDLHIGFNPALIMRALSKIGSGTISINATTFNRAFILLASAEPELTFLIMPSMWNK